MLNSSSLLPDSVDYWLHRHWAIHGDPRIADLPLVHTATPMLVTLLSYAAFVLYLGPKWMEGRKPYQLKGVLLFYNTFMVLVNALFFYFLIEDPGHTLHRLLDTKFPDFNTIKTSEISDKERVTILKCYFYLLSKVVDLLDTVFFVLRKKQSQVTALHVYHHFSVPFFGFIYLRLNAICHVLVPFAFMNTFIHVLMYSYYALAALGPHMAPYLWWKRYLTQLQIVQFAVLFLHGLFFLLRQEGYAPFFVANYLLQVSIYLVLFTQFYLRSYKLDKAKQQQEGKGKSGQVVSNGNVGVPEVEKKKEQ